MHKVPKEVACHKICFPVLFRHLWNERIFGSTQKSKKLVQLCIPNETFNKKDNLNRAVVRIYELPQSDRTKDDGAKETIALNGKKDTCAPMCDFLLRRNPCIVYYTTHPGVFPFLPWEKQLRRRELSINYYLLGSSGEKNCVGRSVLSGVAQSNEGGQHPFSPFPLSLLAGDLGQ